MSARQAWRIFRVPLMLAVVTLFGLLSALLGDGLWDVLSWIALGLPLAVIAWKLLAAR
ncbi:MAG TPA: hypothetical protein VGO34_10975 [Alphaproteobacteria bacterium]|jgi:hypothetical protein